MEHVFNLIHVIVQQDIMAVYVKTQSVANFVSMEIVQVQTHVLVIVDGMDQHVLRVIYIH
jgi:hypothetical protein